MPHRRVAALGAQEVPHYSIRQRLAQEVWPGGGGPSAEGTVPRLTDELLQAGGRPPQRAKVLAVAVQLWPSHGQEVLEAVKPPE